MDRRKSPSRAGFTLVEVLVAILIIATLVAILLPALRGAFRRAQEAQVSAELNNLATALASFKNTFGDYPPSRIILSEEGFNLTLQRTQFTNSTMIPGADSNDLDITYSQLAQRSLLYLRRFWPRVDFNGAQGFDFNNDGVNNGFLVLSGSECLSFFLAGVPLNNINPLAVPPIQYTTSPGFKVTGAAGFSKLPTAPFPYLVNFGTTSSLGTNRTAPNYEFNAGRLIDLDGDGIPSYIDPLDISPSNRRSYAYFCSYGTNSYDPNDVNGFGNLFDATQAKNASTDFEYEDDGTTDVERGFSVGFPVGQAGASTLAVSTAPNPYCSSTPVASTGAMSWINPNSFQLLCAGADRNWGLGGQYIQTSLGSVGKLPISPNPPDVGDLHADDKTGVRLRESDNITNFSGGRLD